MSDFDLEHWKSRATVAESERDSARRVLARLRGYFRKQEEQHPVTIEQEPLRKQLREHDQTWWTQEHAMNAVAEFFSGVEDEPTETPTPEELEGEHG
jgi:hypothetical protein